MRTLTAMMVIASLGFTSTRAIPSRERNLRICVISLLDISIGLPLRLGMLVHHPSNDEDDPRIA